jgi:dihydroorotase
MVLQSILGTCVFQDRTEKTLIVFDDHDGLIRDVVRLDPYVSLEQLKSQFGLFFSPYSCSPGSYIFPGFGDVHIHAREDSSLKDIYKEDFQSCSEAALNGGVTFVADMPNNPFPIVNEDLYQKKILLSQRTHFPFLFYAAIGPHTRPLAWKVPYKVYMAPSIGPLFFQEDTVLGETLSAYKNQWVSFHCEDPQLLDDHQMAYDHFSKRPVMAEWKATEKAIHWIESYQLKGKLCHFSTGQGIELVKQARKRGVSLQLEVTPQHLYFDEETLKETKQDHLQHYQMNPPLRKKEDRELLLHALKAGDIDYLATDHAPHSIEEKQLGHSGLCGLDTYGLFVCWLMNVHNIHPCLIYRLCCENPGSFFQEFLPSYQQLWPAYGKWGLGVGRIAKGYAANFTILNLQSETRVCSSLLKTKTKQSPFEGCLFPGKVEGVWLSGKRYSSFL